MGSCMTNREDQLIKIRAMFEKQLSEAEHDDELMEDLICHSVDSKNLGQEDTCPGCPINHICYPYMDSEYSVEEYGLKISTWLNEEVSDVDRNSEDGSAGNP